ncbi:MAG: hypothetical protein COA82_08190 [Alkaliphilus sp.]|nr:MAG: hypothetical protein COA82_08190 [Alkaliphilus sp.]
MNRSFENKIDAANKSIKALLKEQKFYIDYFQREYRWEKKHIKLLVEDLTTAFLKSYNRNDNRSSVANYQSYYLGPVVLSVNAENGEKSIIDGQQRITSITLLLIYLNHLQMETCSKVSIGELILSEKYGKKSFNMTDIQREPCLKSLFNEGKYNVKEKDSETAKNMVARYDDIAQAFPEELTEIALPYFIDWFIEKVVIVEIIAYSDENAYMIFETMNDRGLNLTPTEMLKGYVLSKITKTEQRNEVNAVWEKQIQELHKYNETADQTFFQTWFRSKYASSIRPGKVGSENQDFELIGSQFHNWFKDKHRELLKLYTSDDFYEFFKTQFPFFAKWYVKSWDAQCEFDNKASHLYYVNYWGIAESLQDPLLLAAINYGDTVEIAKMKLDFVARFIETFTVRRAVNYRKFGQTSIKYTMFNLVKLIRSNKLIELGENLASESDNIKEAWDGIMNFGLHGQNRKFVKHLLSRISSYLDSIVGKESNYASYHHPNGRQFEIEHIWGNIFDEHRDEFKDEQDFQICRNSIGALLLLPNGTNQSFGSDKYEEKINHYLKENVYAQTLNSKYYEKNPNFLKSIAVENLGFTPHAEFNKADIIERRKLVQRICEQIWSTDFYRVEAGQ